MHSSRRQLLKSGTAAAALSYRRILGANDRIRLAGIGTGGRCRYLLQTAERVGGNEIVALCDVYEPRREDIREKLAPNAKLYSDYRAVLERTDVDAVVIGSPDHWHVPMVTDAVRAGKDAYVEKPVSHTTEEGDRLDKLMAQSDRIVQVGYQQRSWPHFIEARELVTSGKLGRISMVLTSWYQNYLAMKEANIDVAKLDWKRFLGSAPDQPFDVNRFTRWRWYWDFGGGHLTDLFSHWGDVVHWYMDSDSPATASATGERYVLPQFECPDTITAAWRYPGFQLSYVGTLSGSLDGGNLLFRGTEAMMKLNRDGYAVYPEGRIRPERTNYPEAAVSGESKGDGTVAHMHNFLDCVRSRKEPNSPVRTAVKIARVAHLANTAMRNGVVWKA